MNSKTGRVKAELDRVDEFQRTHKSQAIPVAVFRKFTEDQSTTSRG